VYEHGGVPRPRIRIPALAELRREVGREHTMPLQKESAKIGLRHEPIVTGCRGMVNLPYLVSGGRLRP
jgi:hypothetical protein